MQVHDVTRKSLQCLAFIWTIAAGCSATAPPPAAVAQAALAQPRMKQEPLDNAGWDKELAADPDLTKMAAAQAAPRQAAGVIEDLDSNRLVWAEFAASSYEDRQKVDAIFRYCDKAGVCTRGTGKYTATGIALVDSQGLAISSLPIGIPDLYKMSKSGNLDTDASTYLAPLSSAAPLDAPLARFQASQIKKATRRFVVLNNWGKAVGVDVTPVIEAAKAAGHWDSVELIEFVRRPDIDLLLPSLTPLDAVIWLGSGVQKKAAGGGVGRNVGMTVSRGIFGDELYYGKSAQDLLIAPPLGGPGLIVLVGGNSVLKDNASDTLVSKLHGAPLRPVVGIEGRLTLEQALKATLALVQELTSGKDLETSMQSAAPGGSAAWASPMDTAARKHWTLAAKSANFWAVQASLGNLTVLIDVEPHCVKALQTCDLNNYSEAFKDSSQRIPSEQLHASTAKFDCEAVFHGPFFECKAEVAATGAKFSLSGVFRGTNKGDHVEIFIDGVPGVQFTALTIVGDGVLEGTDIAGGTTSMTFGGAAAAAAFVDADGLCCLAQSPNLKSYDGKSSTFKLSH